MKKLCSVIRIAGLGFAATLLHHPGSAFGKPVSYVGGLMLMQENDAGGHMVGLDYTVTPRMAVAFHAQYHIRGDNFTMLGPQMNFLVKRWNAPRSQGNIFTNVGGGTTIDRNGDMRPATWTGLLADYETRRLFVSYEVQAMYAPKVERSVWQRARAGIAFSPVDYTKVSPWAMVQVDYRDETHLGLHVGAKEPKVEITPLIRVMYRAFLIEGGVSHRGKLMFNWVKQF
ncbi:MAG: hypothetical protein AB7I36_12840 [Rhodospirillaceae bacterium]